MKGKQISTGMAIAIMAMIVTAITGCGKKDKKIPLSSQENYLRAIKAAERHWRKSSPKRDSNYFYRVDASQFTEGNPPAHILVGIKDDVVQCRKLVINDIAQWVEKGDDINGRKNYPKATTIERGLDTCRDYAEEEFTSNYRFDFTLNSKRDLETYGCYYEPPIKSRAPRMVVAPRTIVSFDPGICKF